MNWKMPEQFWGWTRLGCGVAVIAVAAATYSWWWPSLTQWVDKTVAARSGAEEVSEPDDPSAAGISSITLSPQARLNLGLTADQLLPIQLSTFNRSLTVPAVIVAKPGRSKIVVASPLSGVITHVHAVTGEAVTPGELLFEIRLTYEDLVQIQTEYLRTISELEVENREITRLEIATQTGAISGKSLLERRYAKDKLEASLRSQREALRLHGLSDRQIDTIGRDGKLLGDLQVVAPDVDEHSEHETEELRLSQTPYLPVTMVVKGQSAYAHNDPEHPLVVEDLQVHKGQSVVAGEQLCSLSDYSQLYIEGKAFELDAAAISTAAGNQWPVDAVFPTAGQPQRVSGLRIAFVGNAIDDLSRTLSLFVELPNRIARDTTTQDGQRYITWDYRLGQRLEIQIPVEQWQDQIVVPVGAIEKEGADWFVFQQNGDRFDRIAVHVMHRDQTWAVIANDGSLYPGDVIAQTSAHQLQMAIKNKSGAAPDPHAGHSH